MVSATPHPIVSYLFTTVPCGFTLYPLTLKPQPRQTKAHVDIRCCMTLQNAVYVMFCLNLVVLV